MAREPSPSRDANWRADNRDSGMHYHAIQRSNREGDPTPTLDLPIDPPQGDLANRDPRTAGCNKGMSYGNDDAADVQTMARISELQIIDEVSFFGASEPQIDSEHEQNRPSSRHLQHAIPTSSPGLTTIAYQHALRNRIEASQLLKNNTYDLTRYTPTFIHDALMLPGSLAGVLCKGSSGDLVNRMTPALLPGHHPHIDSKTLQPCLVRSDNARAYVQGMLIFGQGKTSRDAVHKHYRPEAKRRKVGVEVDVWVEVPPGESVTCPWRLERRTVQAHAWIWSKELNDCKGYDCRDWTIEDSLAGTLEEELPMRIELDGQGDEAHEEWLGEDSSMVGLEGGEGALESGKHEASITFHSFERDTWLE